MLKAKFNKPESGWDEDQERCRELLILDEVYDVYDVEAHSWHTDVYLCGFDKPFNSVNFTYYDKNGNEVELSDTEEWQYSEAHRW